MTQSKEHIVPSYRRSALMGTGIFAIDTLLLVLCGWGALVTTGVLQFFFSAAFGMMISILFVVGHDAAHHSLTPCRWLNNLLGRAAMLPSLHAFSLWQLVHNQTHHRWTNLSPQDYVWTPLSPEQFAMLSFGRKCVYRFYRSAFGPFFYYFFEFWLRRIAFPSRQEVRGEYKPVYVFDILTVWLFGIGYLAFLIEGGRQGYFQGTVSVVNAIVFGFLVPFGVWNFMMGFVIYLHHTHPSIRWFNDYSTWRMEARQSQGAVHVVFPGPINYLFHRIMEHNAHHARPSIPLYRLNEAQKTLANEEPLVVLHWSLANHLDIVQRCKLYDFVADRWIDFDGEYTSPCTRIDANLVPKPHFSKKMVQARPPKSQGRLTSSTEADVE